MPATFVQCKGCFASASVPEGVDPHTFLQCACCTEDHHHGIEANACPVCPPDKPWAGLLMSGPRPDGCTHCRPLLFMANAMVTPTSVN